ncbi:glycosyltransferase family 4 protein [Picosynechococcus sp. PCC 11901]|uniref:glycosyltransferase family 4 protein n=1 Tax=Picosynechococcus sp. PCC 11901 TaxID=2579791 RepID=UPI0010FC13C4|nr:glycosyltransferase family 4 protein [Picosynechococcus sp. PCC 11901]QCS50071.1 glycosyltransferase family 4 protein [Picosynechococcus sp. PCC 11901]
MSPQIRTVFYSILPSPYQRDLFAALAKCSEINLKVNYLEMSVDDSPWPQKPLKEHETILVGTDLRWGASRFHLNWHLPNFHDTDIIVLNGYQSFVSQWILRTQSKKIPCIFWGEKMVGAATGIKGKLQQTFANSVNYCQAIAAIGEAAVQDYKSRYPDKLVVPIPYYCNLDAFQQDIPQRPRELITILFCGQMIERKGLDLLLTAFARLIEAGLKAKLVLVGRKAELPQMMAKLPEFVKKQIDYAGFQAPEDLPQFFRQADIFVLPSRYDGWGVVVNQAVGAGLPIICSDAVGSAPDLVTMGENGFIFPAGDVAKLHEALHYYVSEPARITVASVASQRRSLQWSSTVGAERWLDLFKRVLA